MFRNRIIGVVVLATMQLALYSQVSDTLYIYETVYVTDTIWLESNIERDTTPMEPLKSIQNATLLLDTVQEKASLIYFINHKSATIPINRIYVNRNQLNQTEMKKAGFFTLMFLAFQSISFAQPELSIKAGFSRFSESNSTLYGDSDYSGLHQGIEIKTPIYESDLSFSVGIDFLGFSDESLNVFQDDRFVVRSNVSQKAIPILIYYGLWKVELFAGYEYRLVQSVSVAEPSIFLVQVRNRFEHGISAGIEFSIFKNLSLQGKYYTGDIFNIERSHIISGNSLDFSLKYYLNRNR